MVQVFGTTGGMQLLFFSLQMKRQHFTGRTNTIWLASSCLRCYKKRTLNANILPDQVVFVSQNHLKLFFGGKKWPFQKNSRHVI